MQKQVLQLVQAANSRSLAKLGNSTRSSSLRGVSHFSSCVLLSKIEPRIISGVRGRLGLKLNPYSTSSTVSDKKPVAFVSGPVILSPAEFDAKIKPKLDEAIKNGDSFIIGDKDKGTDAMALDYLQANGGDGIKSRVRVYITEQRYEGRYKERGFEVVDAGPYNMEWWKNAQKRPPKLSQHLRRVVCKQRDEKMTRESSYDILFIRSAADSKDVYGDKYNGTEPSAAERNRERRLKLSEGGSSSAPA